MIAAVRGTILNLGLASAVVDIGGVGLQLALTPAHALRLSVGEEAEFKTALIVRDDDLSLFGFSDDETKAAFELLRSVSGVGPKLAMGVLGVLSVDELATAINDEDETAFKNVPGVGPKTAKLIILSLSGKMVQLSAAPATPTKPTSAQLSEQVVSALVGLGWSERHARTAVEKALAESGEAVPQVSSLLRLAMANLGSRSGGAR